MQTCEIARGNGSRAVEGSASPQHDHHHWVPADLSLRLPWWAPVACGAQKKENVVGERCVGSQECLNC